MFLIQGNVFHIQIWSICNYESKTTHNEPNRYSGFIKNINLSQ